MPSQGEPLIDFPAHAELMSGVDHRQVAHLTKAFDIMAQRLVQDGQQVTNGTVMWAVATLLAKVLAAADMDREALDETSKRFGQMLRLAFPAMLRVVEGIRREAAGARQFDA